MSIASKRLNVLHEEWHGCTKCGLHEMRIGSDIFFGSGSSSPKFFIVGGVPSEADEILSSVFSGDEGAVLSELLERSLIDVKDCYFTYSVACRPKVFIPATDTEEERIEGRPPAKEETVACRPRLYEQLYQTDPRVIISVGETATKSMVRGRLPRFVEAQGKQYLCTLHSATKEDREDGKTAGKARFHDLTYPVFAVPEMSAIINNPSMAEHGPYAIALRTIARAREYVEFVIRNELDTMKGKS